MFGIDDFGIDDFGGGVDSFDTFVPIPTHCDLEVVHTAHCVLTPEPFVSNRAAITFAPNFTCTIEVAN
jgi:hypothetical protein